MGLWLQQGVDGFRIDAAPFLIIRRAPKTTRSVAKAHQFLRR